jgi:hypothetical protein
VRKACIDRLGVEQVADLEESGVLPFSVYIKAKLSSVSYREQKKLILELEMMS